MQEELSRLARQVKLDTIEACAKIVEPNGPRPCDCERCYCHNVGDAEDVARWEADTANAKAIRALAGSSGIREGKS